MTSSSGAAPGPVHILPSLSLYIFALTDSTQYQALNRIYMLERSGPLSQPSDPIFSCLSNISIWKFNRQLKLNMPVFSLPHSPLTTHSSLPIPHLSVMTDHSFLLVSSEIFLIPPHWVSYLVLATIFELSQYTV